MGIEKLNTLLVNASHYEGKFDTIIIDGSNLLITFISAIISGIKKENYYAPWNTFNLDLIRVLYEIIHQTTNSILLNLNLTKRCLLNKNGKIIFIIDSNTEPSYITYNNQILYLKSEERKARKQKQNRSKNINEEIEKIKLEYGIFIDNICINENEILNLFSQLDYFNNAGNYLKLTSIILHNVMRNIENVTFIQAISEADFVIKNLANVYNDNPVLVMSEDTDYMLLLANVENAYKTSIKVKQPIYYPYEFWKETIDEQISYNELIYITTLMGNDYVGHKTFLTMDPKNSEKNINKIKGLCNIENHLNDDIKSSSMKKIKPILNNFNPNKFSSINDYENIFKNLDEEYNNAILIYNSWIYNFDYKILNYEENLFETLLDGILNKYNQTFESIITFDKHELDNNIKINFKNTLNIIVNKIKYTLETSYFNRARLSKFKLELLLHLTNDELKRKLQQISSKETFIDFLNKDLSYLYKFKFITNFKEYYNIIDEEHNECYLID